MINKKRCTMLADKRQKKPYLLHIELLRIVAIQLVIFQHTYDYGIFRYRAVDESFRQWVYLSISLISRGAVPIFLMLSGAVLLGKNEPYSTIFRKRVLKYSLVLLAASYGYWRYDISRGGTSASGIEFLTTIYTLPWSVPLWYLYCYLGLLLMLPLLRRLVQGMTNRDYIYLACMSILFSEILPMVEAGLSDGEQTMFFYLKGALFESSEIVYFLMGYYFEHVMPRAWYNKRVLIYAMLLSILSLLACAAMTLYCEAFANAFTELMYNMVLAVPVFTIYMFAKNFFEMVSIPDWVERGILMVSSTCFGIYLMERFLRDCTGGVLSAMIPHIGIMPSGILWVLSTFAVGFVLVFLLKQIPVIRDLL